MWPQYTHHVSRMHAISQTRPSACTALPRAPPVIYVEVCTAASRKKSLQTFLFLLAFDCKWLFSVSLFISYFLFEVSVTAEWSSIFRCGPEEVAADTQSITHLSHDHTHTLKDVIFVTFAATRYQHTAYQRRAVLGSSIIGRKRLLWMYRGFTTTFHAAVACAGFLTGESCHGRWYCDTELFTNFVELFSRLSSSDCGFSLGRMRSYDRTSSYSSAIWHLLNELAPFSPSIHSRRPATKLSRNSISLTTPTSISITSSSIRISNSTDEFFANCLDSCSSTCYVFVTCTSLSRISQLRHDRTLYH